MYDPWAANDTAEEIADAALINYKGATFTQEEAAQLAGWLGMPEFELLKRLFTYVRDISVEMMDTGAVAEENFSEMVRQSAVRSFIANVTAMQGSLEESVKQARESV